MKFFLASLKFANVVFLRFELSCLVSSPVQWVQFLLPVSKTAGAWQGPPTFF